jgi:hypothetical protein
VRFGTHPLTGDRVIRGAHAAESDDLAALELSGMIYTSQAFAALRGLGPPPGALANSWATARCAPASRASRFSSCGHLRRMRISSRLR